MYLVNQSEQQSKLFESEMLQQTFFDTLKVTTNTR